MSDIGRDRLFESAVGLVLKQTELVDLWAGRLVAVHAGLGTTVGLIASWKGLPLAPPLALVVVLLGALAMVITVLVNGLIQRHLAWHRGFIDSVKLIEGDVPLLFRNNMVPLDRGLQVGAFYQSVTTALFLGWFIVIVIALA